MNPLASALAGIGRRFIGGYRTRYTGLKYNKYLPHQNSREKERRVRQAAKKDAR